MCQKTEKKVVTVAMGIPISPKRAGETENAFSNGHNFF